MKKPKLMIADIDGTLMPKGDGISEMTRDVLNRIHKAGIWFCIASGRPLDEVALSVKEYELDFEPEFVVGMNGGEIQDNFDGSQIVQFLLSEEQILNLVQIMDKQPCNITMYRGKNLYAKEWDEMVSTSAHRAGKPTHVVKSLEEFAEVPNAKLMLRTDTAEICDELQDFARGLNLPMIRFFKTQPNLLEVCDERVHKGAALDAICEKYNIDFADVVAFGDASNDNEMIEKAGLGVCLLNGLDDTKALADVITDETCEDDGLPKWILKNYGEYL